MNHWKLEIICPKCSERMLVELNDEDVFELPTRCPKCYYPESDLAPIIVTGNA